jgi:cytolysin (calcineurin-like family phosphatase)
MIRPVDADKPTIHTRPRPRTIGLVLAGVILLAGLWALPASARSDDAQAQSPPIPSEPKSGGIDGAPVWVAVPPPPTPSSYFIVTSDPQYPWTPFMDFTAEHPSADEHGLSRRLIHEQYASINRFAAGKRVHGTFINGDLTAFGHGWQIDFMKYAISLLNQPVYLGLGNHDYENNTCAESWCARQSVRWFLEHMGRMQPDAMDVRERFYYRFPSSWREIEGSLGWTKTFDEITVIQLNYHPAYRTWVDGWDFAGAYREALNIQPSLAWFEAQLKIAARAGRSVIVMLHKDQSNDAFEKLLKTYGVTAVFAGHYHDWFGRVPFKDPPLYLSGSASQRTYLIAEVKPDEQRLAIWLVYENREQSPIFQGEVPLRVAGSP